MILVVGATGQLGGMIAQRLLEQGKDVRILVRPGSPYQPLADAGAEPVLGDLKDRTSLDEACIGVTAVITTANSARRGGEDNVESVDLQGNRNLIDAATGAGIEHFIFISNLNATEDSPVPLFQAKAKTETYLRESGMNFTILSSNRYMEVWIAMAVGGPLQADQPVTLVGEASHKHTFVSMGDVVEFATASLENPAAANAQIMIGGPEALTWREVVEVFEDVLGREIQTNLVAPGEPVPGLPEVMAAVMAGMETYDSPLDMAETSSTFGVQLTPLEDFVRSQFAASEH